MKNLIFNLGRMVFATAILLSVLAACEDSHTSGGKGGGNNIIGLWAYVGDSYSEDVDDIVWPVSSDEIDTFVEITSDGYVKSYYIRGYASIENGVVSGIDREDLILDAMIPFEYSNGQMVNDEGIALDYYLASSDRLALPQVGGGAFGLYVRCKSFGDSDSGNGEQPDDPTGFTIPQSLSTGDAITLSNMSPLMFGYFKVTGLGEGQWGMTENSDISPSYSQATFQYSVTGKTTAHLSSQNYQSVTERTYTIELYLTFDSATTGSYILNDSALGTTSSYSTKGTFEIK